MSWLNNRLILIPSAMVAAVGGLSILKDRTGGDFVDKKIRADGKTIIITGASSGIGERSTYEFARRGATVYMACRDMKKCNALRKEIVLITKNRYVYCRPLDLSSQKSIREFVKIFNEEQESLDVLINNAAVMRCPKSVTKEGIEMQLGVNHMGHFLLTNLLLPLIKDSSPSRIINLTCSSHAQGKIHKDDLNMDKEYDTSNAYNQSKLANILFTFDLAIKLLETKVTVNAVDPGLTDTDITRHLPSMKSITSPITYCLMWPFIKSPIAGAQSVVHAALDPSLEKVTGQYLRDMKVTDVAPHAVDLELGRWLWAVSEKWTKLKEVE